MSSMTGDKIKISVFGQSHSKGIGVVIDGLPAGHKIDMEKVLTFMDRRAPGKNSLSTQKVTLPKFCQDLLTVLLVVPRFVWLYIMKIRIQQTTII